MNILNKVLSAVSGVVLGAVVSTSQVGCMGDHFGDRTLGEMMGSSAPGYCPLPLAPLFDAPGLLGGVRNAPSGRHVVYGPNGERYTIIKE